MFIFYYKFNKYKECKILQSNTHGRLAVYIYMYICVYGLPRVNLHGAIF